MNIKEALSVLLLFALSIVMLVLGVYLIFNAKSYIRFIANKKDSSWYYSKTKIGKMQLSLGKKVISEEESILNAKIAGVISILMGLLLSYAFISQF